MAWPAAGLLTGLLLVEPPRSAASIVLAALLLVAAHLLTGYDAVSALGFGLSTVAVPCVYRRLRRGWSAAGGLLEDGDVSRLIAAATQGAAVAAARRRRRRGDRHGIPWLAAVAVWGTHAAAQLMLVRSSGGSAVRALAPPRERVVQAVIISA